ncbi:DUF262 domain-containing protein [Micrococcus luteus]|uniref:DUF262 domain-containing protein n=1 Tax=Micrococcus luteus TaxID=1270 RepID=UPI000DF929D4|nr:DUF262 domain-containing protein [Micrococcus luteus]STY67936.1 Uncharacterized conserved protein [Micrococcus luteus]
MQLLRSDPEIDSLYRRVKSGKLNLQPEFQRGEVWTIARQQRLVDSVLREWYIPPIHVVVNNANEEMVLDGQQRLSSVVAFMDDEFPVNGLIDPLDDAIKQLGGLKFSELPEDVAERFRSFVIQTVKITGHHPQESNEFFFRLNQGVSLTSSEKRNALYGDSRDYVRSVVKDLQVDGLLSAARIGFSNGRLAYDDIVARCSAYAESEKIDILVNNNYLEALYRNDGISLKSAQRVLKAGTYLNELIENTGYDGIKFNKATLQTWISFIDRMNRSGVSIPKSLLREFTSIRIAIDVGGASQEGSVAEVHNILQDPAAKIMMELYRDRSSYRVQDVSSVLIRDFVITWFFLNIHPKNLNGKLSLGRIGNLESGLASASDPGAFLGEYLRNSSWGSWQKVLA